MINHPSKACTILLLKKMHAVSDSLLNFLALHRTKP